MSTDRRQPASSRKPTPQRPTQPHIIDAHTLARIAGPSVPVIPVGILKNRATPFNTPHNVPILTTGTTTHGVKPGQTGNPKARKAPGAGATPPPASRTDRTSEPPSNLRKSSISRTGQASQAPLSPPRRFLALDPLPIPRPLPLPKPISFPKPIPLAKPLSIPKPRPLPKPRPIPRAIPIPRGLPIDGQAPESDESELESEDEVGVELAGRKFSSEQDALKALLRIQMREEGKLKMNHHYQLVLSAAKATISLLKRLGLSSAVFGSLACKLYGDFRYPNDVDLLVFRQLSSDPDVRLRLAEQTKAVLVKADPLHFYLKLPRNPAAPYRILYFRSGRFGPSCKVDILVPGTMHLPNIPPPSPPHGTSSQDMTLTSTNVSYRNRLTTISGIPLVPFSLLLLHKLQGWADHRSSFESHKKSKEPQDAADIQCLLQMDEMVGELQETQPWTNLELFSEEFQQLTNERVKEYCKVFPSQAVSWQMLGFETT